MLARLTSILFAGRVGSPGRYDGQASEGRFCYPSGLTLDHNGNLYIADQCNHTIRKISPSAEVSTVAGVGGGWGSVDGLGDAAQFAVPWGIVADPSANVYVSEAFNHTIRMIKPNGEVTTLAGLAGSKGSIDGPGHLARFNSPRGLALDKRGNLYVADTENHVLRRIAVGGEVTTLAGLAGSPGSMDGTRNSARFNLPYGVAVDDSGNIYVADAGNHTLRRIAANGEVATLAGLAGVFGIADGVRSTARFNFPCGVAVVAGGSLYVADRGNYAVRKVDANGCVRTLPQAFNLPSSVGVDEAGNIYVVASGRHTIAVVRASGEVATLSGYQPPVYPWMSGSGWLPRSPYLAFSARPEPMYPAGVAMDTMGRAYLADNFNNVILRSMAGCPDRAVIDSAAGLVGLARQLDAEPQTATSWHWSLIRRPSGSTAELSSATIQPALHPGCGRPVCVPAPCHQRHRRDLYPHSRVDCHRTGADESGASGGHIQRLGPDGTGVDLCPRIQRLRRPKPVDALAGGGRPRDNQRVDGPNSHRAPAILPCPQRAAGFEVSCDALLPQAGGPKVCPT